MIGGVFSEDTCSWYHSKAHEIADLVDSEEPVLLEFSAGYDPGQNQALLLRVESDIVAASHFQIGLYVDHKHVLTIILTPRSSWCDGDKLDKPMNHVNERDFPFKFSILGFFVQNCEILCKNTS